MNQSFFFQAHDGHIFTVTLKGETARIVNQHGRATKGEWAYIRRVLSTPAFTRVGNRVFYNPAR